MTSFDGTFEFSYKATLPEHDPILHPSTTYVDLNPTKATS